MTAPTLLRTSPLGGEHDRLALERLDDDGSPNRETLHVSRFALAPVLGLGAVDGAWWPRSRDAATELAPLLAALAPRIGWPTRVSLNLTAWRAGSRQVCFGGHRARLSWYGHMGPATVSIGTPHQPQVRLLVIPRRPTPSRLGLS